MCCTRRITRVSANPPSHTQRHRQAIIFGTHTTGADGTVYELRQLARNYRQTRRQTGGKGRRRNMRRGLLNNIASSNSVGRMEAMQILVVLALHHCFRSGTRWTLTECLYVVAPPGRTHSGGRIRRVSFHTGCRSSLCVMLAACRVKRQKNGSREANPGSILTRSPNSAEISLCPKPGY